MWYESIFCVPVSLQHGLMIDTKILILQRKLNINGLVYFQCDLYIFVQIQHDCINDIGFARDPSDNLSKRFWLYLIKKCSLQRVVFVLVSGVIQRLEEPQPWPTVINIFFILNSIEHELLCCCLTSTVNS